MIDYSYVCNCRDLLVSWVRQHAGGGEIIDHIAKLERLPEAEARQYFRQMISAMGMFLIPNLFHCLVLHMYMFMLMVFLFRFCFIYSVD